MSTTYRKVASEEGATQQVRHKRKVKSYPELRMAAEIAGVKYWTAYKVRVGKTQSEKVELALKIARDRLHTEKMEAQKVARKQRAEAKRAARKQLRELRAQEKQIVRAQRQIVRALGRRKAA
jgi:hypothetical protein